MQQFLECQFSSFFSCQIQVKFNLVLLCIKQVYYGLGVSPILIKLIVIVCLFFYLPICTGTLRDTYNDALQLFTVEISGCWDLGDVLLDIAYRFNDGISHL